MKSYILIKDLEHRNACVDIGHQSITISKWEVRTARKSHMLQIYQTMSKSEQTLNVRKACVGRTGNNREPHKQWGAKFSGNSKTLQIQRVMPAPKCVSDRRSHGSVAHNNMDVTPKKQITPGDYHSRASRPDPKY